MAELGDIVAEPVDPVTANSSPSSKTPSPSLSTKAKASDNGPFMALMETGAMLSELPAVSQVVCMESKSLTERDQVEDLSQVCSL